MKTFFRHNCVKLVRRSHDTILQRSHSVSSFKQSEKHTGNFLNTQHEYVKPLLLSALNTIDLDVLNKKNHVRILDIGFGSGMVIQELLNHFNNKLDSFSIDAIDKDDEWFNYVSDKFSNEIRKKQIRLHQLNITETDKLDYLTHITDDSRSDKHYFDLITSRYVFQHLGDSITMDTTIKSIVNKLLDKNGGYMIMQEATEFVNPIFKLNKDYYDCDDQSDNIDINISINTRDDDDEMVMKKNYPNIYYFMSNIFLKFYFDNNMLCKDTISSIRLGIDEINSQSGNEFGIGVIGHDTMQFGGKNGSIGFESCIKLISQRVEGSLQRGFISQKEFDLMVDELKQIKDDTRAELYTEMLESFVVKTYSARPV